MLIKAALAFDCTLPGLKEMLAESHIDLQRTKTELQVVISRLDESHGNVKQAFEVDLAAFVTTNLIEELH